LTSSPIEKVSKQADQMSPNGQLTILFQYCGTVLFFSRMFWKESTVCRTL